MKALDKNILADICNHSDENLCLKVLIDNGEHRGREEMVDPGPARNDGLRLGREEHQVLRGDNFTFPYFGATVLKSLSRLQNTSPYSQNDLAFENNQPKNWIMELTSGWCLGAAQGPDLSLWKLRVRILHGGGSGER